MELIMDWGVNVVLWFQQFSPALDLPFTVFTFLGDEEFSLLFLPFVYWCLDRRTGARLTVLFLLSMLVNYVAKAIGAQPRPFQYDARVRMIRAARGYGLPSGHTQNAVVVWGYIGSQFRRRWLWVVVATLVILIPLSRVYLGVHFPHDLAGGYLLGAACLALFLWLDPRVEGGMSQKGLAWQLGLMALVPALTIALYPSEDSVTQGATFMSVGVGFILERRWVRFEPSPTWWKRLVAFLLGIVVIGGLWGGLRVAFDGLSRRSYSGSSGMV
jgi:undecaprenyl-diphosphatase